MANVLGMDSIGVELSAKRCKKARLLDLHSYVSAMSPGTDVDFIVILIYMYLALLKCFSICYLHLCFVTVV